MALAVLERTKIRVFVACSIKNYVSDPISDFLADRKIANSSAESSAKNHVSAPEFCIFRQK
jgi:hypothetical protein